MIVHSLLASSGVPLCSQAQAGRKKNGFCQHKSGSQEWAPNGRNELASLPQRRHSGNNPPLWCFPLVFLLQSFLETGGSSRTNEKSLCLPDSGGWKKDGMFNISFQLPTLSQMAQKSKRCVSTQYNLTRAWIGSENWKRLYLIFDHIVFRWMAGSFITT